MNLFYHASPSITGIHYEAGMIMEEEIHQLSLFHDYKRFPLP